MDKSTLRIPLVFYLAAVVLFPLPGLILLFAEGHWGAAILTIFGILYAIGLGRTLLWRRLGKPRLPAKPH